MEIVHKIKLERRLTDSVTLDDIGEGSSKLAGDEVSFEVSESDPKWQQVVGILGKYREAAHQERIQEFGLSLDLSENEGIVETWVNFRDDELRSAEYLLIHAGDFGFPEPRDPLLFRQDTYQGGCPICYTGSKQVAPFRMRKAPRRPTFFHLNWLPEELLVRSDLVDLLFRPVGVDSKPVLFSDGSIMSTVRQLAITNTALIDVGDSPYRTCEHCGARSYARIMNDFERSPLNAKGAMFHSIQGFHAFYPNIYVNQELFREIAKLKLRGVGFWPCRSAKR